MSAKPNRPPATSSRTATHSASQTKFRNFADLPQRPDIVELQRVGVTDSKASGTFHHLSGCPSLRIFPCPKPSSPTYVFESVRRFGACSRPRNRTVRKILATPGRFARRTDAFYHHYQLAPHCPRPAGARLATLCRDTTRSPSGRRRGARWQRQPRNLLVSGE